MYFKYWITPCKTCVRDKGKVETFVEALKKLKSVSQYKQKRRIKRLMFGLKISSNSKASKKLTSTFS